MNALKGKIEEIETSGNLSLVSVRVGQCVFKSIVVETPRTADYLVEGNVIMVMFKETEVIIGLGDKLQISLRNKMPGVIKSLNVGTLLAKLVLETNAGEIISIITSNAVRSLGLEEGTSIVAMVKTNEVLLGEC